MKAAFGPEAGTLAVRAFLADIEKYNAAVVAGWRIVRVTPSKLCASVTLAMLEGLLTPAKKGLQEPSAG